MKKYRLLFLTLFLLLAIAESCSPPSLLYRHDNKKKTYAGQLNDSTFTALKKYLTTTTNEKLKDTVLIKYDFNNESCWNILDQSEDEHIMGFVTRHNQRVQRVLANRPNVSVFDFREPGNNLNKIKKWDTSIIIDSTKQLMNLFFQERCTCGSSILVMPDKRFVFLRSDSHSEVLDLTQKDIVGILKKKQE